MDKFSLISTIIEQRRSVFPSVYNGKPIDDQVINQILSLGNWAPTHKRTEPWRYVVMRGEALKSLSEFLYEDYLANTTPEKFSERKALKKKKNPLKCGAVIAICLHRDTRVPEWEEIASVAMSVQNIWLACSTLNIGSYWSSPGAIHRMDKFLGLSKEEKCIGLFYMGYYDIDLPEGQRNPMDTKVKWM